MSGNTKLLNHLFIGLSSAIFLISSLSLDAAEKTVKVREGQSRSQDKGTLSNKVKAVNSNAESVINTERQANYKDVSDPGLVFEKSTKKVSEKVVQQPQFRDKNLATSLKSSEYSFASTYVTMDYDNDGDGYYSEFSVNFDADTNYNSATVYAQLYLSLEGGPWELYYTTNYFDLDGWSSYDDYTVQTILTNGFPPGSYDILIDLYDQYDGALVATISSFDTYELAQHYLEDTSYDDSQSTYSKFSIFDASITLLSDNDNDGFYHSFSLEFDADVDSGSATVYAEIWVKDSSGNWILDNTTSDFIIEGYSTLDTYVLETVWQSGYSTGYYDFRVEIYDAYSDVLLTTSDEQSYVLSSVPLEDAGLDIQSNIGGGTNSGPIASVSSGSGGAGSMGMLTLILAASFLRKRMV